MIRWMLLVAALPVLLFSGCNRNGGSGTVHPTLKFQRNGTFKVAQFTDLHWDETSLNSDSTKAVILGVLEAEQPDLAVVTGDVVTAPPATAGWQSIARIFADTKTPWVLTLGNHDDEAGITRSEVFELLKGSTYFLGEAGPAISGSGNYVLPVYGRNSNIISALLYCVDAHNRPLAHKYGHYDWIHFDQLAWYREQSDLYAKQNGGHPLPALAFFHIPIKEFEQIHRQEEIFGTANEGVASSNINSGLFASFIEKGDVMGAFVGHDHNNDYIGIHYDIALAFGRTTGIDAYGDLERGARIIVLHEGERRFDTWIRTLSGKELTYYYPSALSADEEERMDYLLANAAGNPQEHGLHYRYYEGGRLKKLSDISTNAKLVDSGKTNRITLDIAAVRDSFAIVFNGQIKIAKRGVYRFYTYSDDGSQLSIGGYTVVDNDGSHNARWREGKVALEAGFHDFELAYFEDYMGEALEVGYASRFITEQLLPDSILFLSNDK